MYSHMRDIQWLASLYARHLLARLKVSERLHRNAPPRLELLERGRLRLGGRGLDAVADDGDPESELGRVDAGAVDAGGGHAGKGFNQISCR